MDTFEASEVLGFGNLQKGNDSFYAQRNWSKSYELLFARHFSRWGRGGTAVSLTASLCFAKRLSMLLCCVPFNVAVTYQSLTLPWGCPYGVMCSAEISGRSLCVVMSSSALAERAS